MSVFLEHFFFLFLSVTQTDGVEAFSTCIPQICLNHKCEPETLCNPQLSGDAASCGFRAVRLYRGARSDYYSVGGKLKHALIVAEDGSMLQMLL